MMKFIDKGGLWQYWDTSPIFEKGRAFASPFLFGRS
jgi:hypothetical protein